ncbi:type II toxin-antitoxin system VapC family toxin [Salinisphaera sp.]|uniref:type II toxin-antitoxin system VapC family toxin n=1 Tax=Salinisphaera sp. TaxID=1914330 RepID=UPI002D78D904|nr:type II toxin-antitoxin system VapC family toxin [Salinisphaera sp.]HET7313227.1 type II toxin-antitoxin system VapC family toxin [Salinisphaera sp.]
MLIDTDVLIWAARGYRVAVDSLDAIEQPRLSVVTLIELMQGARNKQEMKDLEQRLAYWGVEIVDLCPDISTQAVALIRKHAHARGLQLADALIAATAIVREVALFSGNRKHYEGIPNLQFQPFEIG